VPRFARLLLRPVLPFLVLLALICPHAVQAEDEPPPGAPAGDVRERVQGWLRDLTSDAFKVREAARTGLQREGLRARDLLEAAAQAEDPEVRRTVAAILARAPGVSRTPAADVRPGDFDTLGRVSLDLEDVPLEQALALLGARLGAHFELPEGAGTKKISVTLGEVPCFRALGALLKAGGLRMPAPFDAHGNGKLVAAAEDDPVVPSAVAGPVRVRVEEVSATRSFGASSAPRYVVKVRLDWAPFVQVTQYQTARVDAARDPDGKPYRPSPVMSRTVHRGVGARTRSATLDIHLIPGQEGCKPELGVLEVTLPLTLRYDLAQVVLDDTARIPVALDVSGKLAGRGQDESVTFLSLLPSEQGEGQWIAEYAAVLKEETPQRTIQSFVREDDGRLTQLYVAGGRSRGADGTMRITARAYRGNKGKPKAIVVTWHRREEMGDLRFRLEGIPLR